MHVPVHTLLVATIRHKFASPWKGEEGTVYVKMDFLSSMGLGGEFQTAVGSEIEKATSERLVSPDWALNMEICDEVRDVACNLLGVPKW